jgi:hypothetical protein
MISMTVDWNVCDERLHAASLAAIRQFADEHPDEPICFFAFDTDPRYGYVLIAFDTFANNVRQAKIVEAFAIEERRKYLLSKDAWRSAKYMLSSPVLGAFSTNSSGFAYPQYAEVQFPEWRQLAEQGSYPVGLAHEDNYLNSSVRLVLWRVAERLVAERAFDGLRLSSPFMVGYGIHDEAEAILRLLNWP